MILPVLPQKPFYYTAEYKSMEEIKALYTPHPIVPNPTFDESSRWYYTQWKQRRSTVLEGKWIIKKEKWYMRIFNRKLRKKLNEMIGDLNRVYCGVFDENDFQKGLKARVSSLEKTAHPETIDCYTCGCVVRKEIAFRGHDRIERIAYHRNRGGLGELVERANEKPR